MIKKKWLDNYQKAKQYYEQNGNLLNISDLQINSWIKSQRSRKKNLAQEQIDLLNEIKIIWDLDDYKWMIGYNYLKEYYQEFGNVEVIYNGIYKGYNLSSWVHNQRAFYKLGKLKQERFKLLKNINFIFEPRKEQKDQWNSMYEKAKQYYEIHGNLLIKDKIKYAELEEWCAKQRQYKNQYSKERIDKLNALEIIWNGKEYNWFVNYSLAKDYYEKYHNLLIPRSYKINGINLGKWIAMLRTNRENINLYKQKLLEDIGMKWEVIDYDKRSWKDSFLILKAYYDKHHEIFSLEQNGENKKIITWIKNQRNNKDHLSQEQVDLLNSIDFIWKLSDYNWEQNYLMIKEHINNYGYLDELNNSLKQWIYHQINKYDNNKLSDDKCLKLEELGIINLNNLRKLTLYRQKKLMINFYKQLINYSNYSFQCKEDVDKVGQNFLDTLYKKRK